MSEPTTPAAEQDPKTALLLMFEERGYKRGKRDGWLECLRTAIEHVAIVRFGGMPTGAYFLLGTASNEELNSWFRGLLTASSAEEAFYGKEHA